MRELKEILDSPTMLLIFAIISIFIIGGCGILSDLIKSFGGCFL